MYSGDLNTRLVRLMNGPVINNSFTFWLPFQNLPLENQTKCRVVQRFCQNVQFFEFFDNMASIFSKTPFKKTQSKTGPVQYHIGQQIKHSVSGPFKFWNPNCPNSNYSAIQIVHKDYIIQSTIYFYVLISTHSDVLKEQGKQLNANKLDPLL